jgi:LysM repeat protein
VSLPARAALANQVHADAFVTLAANGLNDPAISGVVTFYGGPAGYAGGQTRGAALVEQGRVLAQAVQAGVVQTTGAVDRGVQPADFYVLGYTQMPSILIETGFLTNPAEAQRLATPGYQQAIAQGIVAGLGQFFAGPASTAGAPSASGAVAGASAGPGRYTVQSGDTRSGIAVRFGVSPGTLAQLNGLATQDLLFAETPLRRPAQP